MAKKAGAGLGGASLIGAPDPEEEGEDPAEEATESPSEEAGEEKSEGITVDIPVDLIAQDGVPPAQGDTVSAQIDATVQSVTDNTATLSIDAINGEPVGPQTDNSTGGPPPGPSLGGPGASPLSPGLQAMRAKLARGAAANRLGIGM